MRTFGALLSSVALIACASEPKTAARADAATEGGAVYAAALAALPVDAGDAVTVDRRTWTWAGDSAELRRRLEHHATRLPGLSPELVASFVARSREAKRLPDSLPLGRPVEVVDVGPAPGAAVALASSTRRSVLVLSRVAYSPDGSRALVYVTWVCGALCGRAEYVLLERAGAGWRVGGRSTDVVA